MTDILRPILEISVVIPGTLLAYLPAKAYLKQRPLKLLAWMLPLLVGLSVVGGLLCYGLNITTAPVMLAAVMTANLDITENELWFCVSAGLIYNLICWVFVLFAWYPATMRQGHSSRMIILPRPGMCSGYCPLYLSDSICLWFQDTARPYIRDASCRDIS